MAQGTVDADALRQFLRWWEQSPTRLRQLERAALADDPALQRLTPTQIGESHQLTQYLNTLDLSPEDVLAYQTYADGTFGRYRVVALFVGPPQFDPFVLCLDGPRGEAASPHRNGELVLCLYFPRDPPERRWTESKGLTALFALARQHLAAEDIWRRDHRWVLDEAPHGETTPVVRPGRNDKCTCGSGKKSKRCCWR